MLKIKTVARLRQALLDESNNINLDLDNPYGVQLQEFRIDNDNLICDLREKLDGAVRTLRKSDVEGAARDAIPDQELFSEDTYYNTCAVVTSAGSLYRSNLGRFIGEKSATVW